MALDVDFKKLAAEERRHQQLMQQQRTSDTYVPVCTTLHRSALRSGSREPPDAHTNARSPAPSPALAGMR